MSTSLFLHRIVFSSPSKGQIQGTLIDGKKKVLFRHLETSDISYKLVAYSCMIRLNLSGATYDHPTKRGLGWHISYRGILHSTTIREIIQEVLRFPQIVSIPKPPDKITVRMMLLTVKTSEKALELNAIFSDRGYSGSLSIPRTQFSCGSPIMAGGDLIPFFHSVMSRLGSSGLVFEAGKAQISCAFKEGASEVNPFDILQEILLVHSGIGECASHLLPPSHSGK